MDDNTDGSSPHGRGTLDRFPESPQWRRFIPARAGNTFSVLVFLGILAVHPRTGGEHSVLDHQSGIDSGSSPHGRGTPVSDERTRLSDRFIPARAGNTAGHCEDSSLRAVHPRTGGEHLVVIVSGESSSGSSPHGRGTRRRSRSRQPGARFIPARAGNTLPTPSPQASSTVHPRTGGEHAHVATLCFRRDGSSPHGRGTQSHNHSEFPL